MPVRVLGALLICGMLAACVSYPNLYVPPVLVEEKGATGVQRVVADVRATMREHAVAYKRSAQTIDYTALPLIGMAAAAAAALFYGADTDLVAGIGIGAATYVLGRGVLIPDTLPQLYIDGYSAARCVLGHSDMFVGEMAEAQARQLAADVQISTRG